jgi:hypothetical protein
MKRTGWTSMSRSSQAQPTAERGTRIRAAVTARIPPARVQRCTTCCSIRGFNAITRVLAIGSPGRTPTVER